MFCVPSQDIEYINETTDVQIWEGEEELVMVSRYAEGTYRDRKEIILRSILQALILRHLFSIRMNDLHNFANDFTSMVVLNKRCCNCMLLSRILGGVALTVGLVLGGTN